MRFLISTLLPLIILAVHVAATNPKEGDSIPLDKLPHPEDAHLDRRPPPHSYEKAILPENIIPAAHLNNPVSTSFGHDVQPATTGPVPNVSPSCLEAARQEVLAEATQLVGNRNASRLRVVVTAEDIQMELAETNRIAVKIMCATVVGVAGLIVFTVWASTKCPSDDNCKYWRRQDNVNKIEQCKHLDVGACRNPSPMRTLSKPVTSGEHGKRDVMRMSYRCRLELE